MRGTRPSAARYCSWSKPYLARLIDEQLFINGFIVIEELTGVDIADVLPGR